MAAIGRQNVQEQNQQAQTRMRKLALEFKSDPNAFGWLVAALESHSQLPHRGALISFSQVPDQGGHICEGIWVSAERRFHEFSVLLPYNGGDSELESWDDVTDDIVVNAHQPGTGKSFGYLALEVLDEILKS